MGASGVIGTSGRELGLVAVVASCIPVFGDDTPSLPKLSVRCCVNSCEGRVEVDGGCDGTDETIEGRELVTIGGGIATSEAAATGTAAAEVDDDMAGTDGIAATLDTEARGVSDVAGTAVALATSAASKEYGGGGGSSLSWLWLLCHC